MSKFITIIITIVLAISLTACGGNTPTSAQSASEPSSSVVSVVEQTINTEPESSESESSSESEASSDSESSSDDTASETASSRDDDWKATDDLTKMANILETLTDDQFAAVLYDMQVGVKEPIVDYIIDLFNAMLEEIGLRAEDSSMTLKFPELYGRETETFEKVELPQNFREEFGKATSEACSITILEEVKNRGYVFVFKLWGTGDEAFIALIQDKMELS